LMGAMVGGILEYASMISGMKSLYLLGLALYGLSLLFYIRQKDTAEA